MATKEEGSSKDLPGTASPIVETEEPPLSAGEVDQPPTLEAEVRSRATTTTISKLMYPAG